MTRSGGTVQAVGADGTRFLLTVPDQALGADATITLTPVADLTGLPFAAAAAAPAVRIEPAGTPLAQLATLRITPPVAPALADQSLFAIRGGGDGEMHLLPPSADRGAIEVALVHFGVVGLVASSVAERAAVEARLPTELADRWSHVAAGPLGAQRAGAAANRSGTPDAPDVRRRSTGSAELDLLLSGYATELVALANRFTGDCEQARFHFDTRIRQALLVIQATPGALGSGDVQTAYRTVGAIYNNRVDQCLTTLEARCRAHDLRSLAPLASWLPTIGSWIPALLITGFNGPALQGRALALLDGCARFELVHESIMDGVAPLGAFEAQVRFAMPIRLAALGLPFQWVGTAPLEAVALSWVAGCPVEVTAFGGAAPATLIALRLLPELPGEGAGVGDAGFVPLPDPAPPITDVALEFDPGRDAASVLARCPNAPPIPFELDRLWFATFVEFHAAESGNRGWAPRNWIMESGERYARQVWARDLAVAGGTLTENATLELFHRPVLP